MIRQGEHREASDLAIFGGDPLFSRVRTTGQLANRDPDRFFALASGALERRRLADGGPLAGELEERLRMFHGTRHCIVFANACFALMLALKALARQGGDKILLPSLTFRGLPHLIRWAGFEPIYCDVDPSRHTLTPESLARRLGPDTAAVLAVDNVNALCDIDVLERLTAAAGVPLVLDCVYGIAGSYGRDPVGSRGRASVFSLHATKLVNGFEGGYLTTNDDDLAERLRGQRRLGLSGPGEPFLPGLNADLNELHAALALSNLPHLQSIVADNSERFAAYRQAFRSIPWLSFADYRPSPGTYSLVLLKVEPASPFRRDELIRILRAENALVRPYYSPALHRLEGATASADLQVSERVSGELIQMPVGDLVSVDDIERLGAFFALLDRRAGPVVDRLRRGAA